MVIWSLFDGSGIMGLDWAKAGHTVYCFNADSADHGEYEQADRQRAEKRGGGGDECRPQFRVHFCYHPPISCRRAPLRSRRAAWR